ncbi:MAG: UTP--glucose-1-phosphate uridylyltransferase [Fibrobacterota bacterium]
MAGQYTEEFRNKMRRAGIKDSVTALFITQLNRLSEGDMGFIREKDLSPVEYGSLLKKSELSSYREAGKKALQKCAMIKLNGGLGTSMGLQGPKSFLPVRNQTRFIDLVVRQIESLRKEYSSPVPLIFMNSHVTDAATKEFLATIPFLSRQDPPSTFTHNSYPKVLAKDLSPARAEDEELEWNPAGHGDIYASLYTSGLLDSLLEKGITYAFISNVDNLGATLDVELLGYFHQKQFPFLMEVCRRREMDKKGGHIAQKQNRYCLREKAQVAPQDQEYFEDTDKYSYFNSNSIWINLAHLKEFITEKGLPVLPLIANEKHLNPVDTSTPRVYQIETAMGAALALFENSTAVEISQERFRPVKKNNDLMLLGSDRFDVDETGNLIEKGDVTPDITIELDSRYYKTYDDFCRRVQHIPSLKKCTGLLVQGEVIFKKNVTITGRVRITNNSETPLILEDTTINTDMSR